MLLVELDILALKRGVPSYTCMHPPFAVDGTYLDRAKLTARFANKYAIELAEFGIAAPSKPMDTLLIASSSLRYNRHDFCSQSSLDADENYFVLQSGKAPHWCFRRYLQLLFRTVVDWWSSLDAEKHRVLPMQGTLLTTLIRGGEFGIMPWDIDLEIILTSIGVNPLLETCRQRAFAEWAQILTCITDQFYEGLRSQYDDIVVDVEHNAVVSKLLFERGKVLSKIRIQLGLRRMGSVIDIVLHEYVDSDRLFSVPLCGAQLHFSWHQWEYQLFEIYGGDLQKKIGTSGTIDKTVACDINADHNACLRNACVGDSYGCTLEMPDWFAHADAL